MFNLNNTSEIPSFISTEYFTDIKNAKLAF